MAYSYANYTGDGEETNFTIPCPYLLAAHIKVYVDGILKTVNVHYTFLTASVIQFSTAPVSNAVVYIMRDTGRDARLVDFVTGSILEESTLDLNSNQLFYLMQEAFDWVGKAGATENAVFMDQQSILDSITGEIDETFMTTLVGDQFNYLHDYWLDDALFQGDVMVEGLFSVGYAKISLMQDSIDLVVADTAGHTAQLSLLASEFYVKLDDNGNVAGFGLYNAEEDSAFVVNADKFAVVKADGTGDVQYPFVVDAETGIVGIAGSLIVTGSITGSHINANTIEATNIKAGAIESDGIKIGAVVEAKIGAGAVTVDKVGSGAITGVKIGNNAISAGHISANAVEADAIKADAVTATKIDVSTLSAIAADVGTLTAGILTDDAEDPRIEMDLDNKWIKIWDASEVLRVQLGYIP